MKDKSKCTICGETGHNKLFHNEKPTEKKCPMCDLTLSIDNFYTVQKRGRDYPGGYCKKCDVLKSRQRSQGSFKHKADCLISSTKSHCAKKGILFQITTQDILDKVEEQNYLCFYSGEPLLFCHGKDGMSIDRKNPLLGYTKDNIAITSWKINNMKSNTPIPEFIDLCKRISDYNPPRY